MSYPMNVLQELGLGRRTLIMGVLNVTPDSFSDGGEYAAVHAAERRAMEMLDEGADIIDVGGESTRPATFRDGAPLDSQEEAGRVLPVIRAIIRRAPDACISVDTYKPLVALASLEAGARVINDISALGYDPKMGGVAAQFRAPIILMHMPGKPREMPRDPKYGDIITDLKAYFRERVERALSLGVDAEQIVIDPGIGFGKNAAQNMEIIRRLSELKSFGFPVLSAPSRKAFLGTLLGDAPPKERLEGSAAAVALSIAGGADIVRVHDVRFMARLAHVCDGILRSAAL
jgi:dihydropteroate synthase